MRLWALVTSALRMMGNGALLSGPRHLGVAPSLKVLTAERRSGRRSPSSACPYQGPRHLGAGWCCGGPSQGPRHLGTAPAPAGEHPEVFCSVPESGARSRWGWSAAVLSQWMAWRQSPTIGAVGVRGHQDGNCRQVPAPRSVSTAAGQRPPHPGWTTLSFLTHSRQHATRISPSDCTGANPKSCKINWSAVGAPRKVVPNGEGRRGLHIIMIHSSRGPSP